MRVCFFLLVLCCLLPAAHGQAQETAKLTASDGTSSDLLGQIALDLSDDGQYAIGGAWQHDHPTFLSGSAYVFFRDGGAWGEQAELTASDAATGDEFGYGVALSGDGTYAIVGAPGDDDTFFLSGSAYVFTRTGTAWSQQQKLNASDPGDSDRFGSSTALSADGTIALIGARLDGGAGSSTGSAYVFTRSGTTWAEEAKLLASDGADGDRFGAAVALSADGQVALVGAQDDDDAGAGSGAVYIFVRTGTTWTEQAKLTASDAAGGDLFGRAVGISGDGQYAVVGAYLDDDDGADSGSIYIFARTGTTWTEQAKLTASDAAAGDQFGYGVAINDGGTVLMGGANAEDEGGSDAGAAYAFVRNGTTWSEAEKLTASDAAANDFFGRTTALSADGQTVFVGADGDDDNGSDSGSAYVFEDVVVVAIEEMPAEGALLSAAAPNPFRQQARLTLTLAQAEPVRVVLYDLLGREVRVLHDGLLSAQTAQTLIVSADGLPSGLYLVRVSTPSFTESRRVVLQR
ncbi:MAG: T9SS type A sorting domain-containing protein [Rhodothermaceae bacterium]|nr:T9SS type A sorting domain-containing protein [Rhodothermaceae bacterium]